MQRLRDNPDCADQEHQAKQDESDPGLNVKLTFDPAEDIAAPFILKQARPKLLCCGSRALTLTLRWPRLSTVPGLMRSTFI